MKITISTGIITVVSVENVSCGIKVNDTLSEALTVRFTTYTLYRGMGSKPGI